MKPLGGDSGLFPDLDREHPAKVAIRRRLAHMGPSSLCDRPAGSCPGEMSGEECARLLCRVLGRRLFVFEPVAEWRSKRTAVRRARSGLGPRSCGDDARCRRRAIERTRSSLLPTGGRWRGYAQCGNRCDRNQPERCRLRAGDRFSRFAAGLGFV